MDKQWYSDDIEERSQMVFDLVNYYEDNQKMRIESIMANRMMYGSGAGFSRTPSNRNANSSLNAGPRVKVNICKSQISTLTSRITKSEPRLQFATDGADWMLGVKARKLNKFMAGMFNSLDVQLKMREMFQDAQIDDLGALKIFSSENEIKVHQIDVATLYADPRESQIGDIRSLYEVKWVQKEILMDMFPDMAMKIEVLASPENMRIDEKSKVWFVKCIEAWHLPTKKGKKGRHIICVEGLDLFDETWRRMNFPFAFFKPGGGMKGLFGMGLASQLRDIQIEINKTLRTIQLCLHLAVPKILVPKASKIDIEAINNRLGGIIKYSGLKPEVWASSSVPDGLWNHLEWLIRQAYEITGISQLSATGAKPSGLDSGKALREFSDIETERFATVGKAYEQLALDIGAAIIDEAIMNGGKTKLSANFIEGDKLEIIDWKDVNIKKEKYEMTVFPVSSLPQKPYAKLQTIQEMIQAQMVTPQEGRKLLGWPDLKAFEDKKNAEMDLIEKIIYDIAEDGKYTTPDPYMNLELLKLQAKEAIVYYMLHNLPESRLEMFRDLIEDVDTILLSANQELEQLQGDLTNATADVSPEEEGAQQEQFALNEQALAPEGAPPLPQ